MRSMKENEYKDQIEMGTEDINDDYEPFFTKMYQLSDCLKVKKKTKGKYF